VFDQTEIYPLTSNPGLSDRYISEAHLRVLLEKGCVMCKTPFDPKASLIAHYEKLSLHVIGLTTIQAAEVRLAFHEKKSLVEHDVFIVDQKAVVCLKCWVEFLRSVAKLKGCNS
jgi:hypothetical protein